jgi:hypothetical protein
MTHMTHETPSGTTLVQFPPLPLLSGDTFPDTAGTTHALASVTVTLTSDDGTTIEIPLESRFGGWWAPTGTPTP